MLYAMNKLLGTFFIFSLCCMANAANTNNSTWTKIDENDNYATYITPSHSDIIHNNNPLNIGLDYWGIVIDENWKIFYLLLNLNNPQGHSYLIPQAINCTTKKSRCNLTTIYEKHFAQGKVLEQMLPRNPEICSFKHLPTEKIMNYICQ